MSVPAPLKEACRFICFETPVEGFEVATHGGTLFVVLLEGKPYGLTAKHNLHDFAWRNLIVTRTRLSTDIAGIKSVCYAGRGTEAAEGSDLLDIAVVEFQSDVTPSYFYEASFDLSQKVLCRSVPGDELLAYGTLTDFSQIENQIIAPNFAELGFTDVAPHNHDPVLRAAKGQWASTPIKRLSGLSGGPVFNATRGGLCGMTVRGGIGDDGIATLHYIDAFDIVQLLGAIHRGYGSGRYMKTVAHPYR
jgi:hypothetical protein